MTATAAGTLSRFESTATEYSRRAGKQSDSSSVLQFEDLNFFVGKGDSEKHILRDVSGTVKSGHVWAVIGPSGAGKTTLINVLTLDAFYGTPTGSVTLNGVPMSDSIFKKCCYVVKQKDKHWPYLTCREALMYAAELYQVAPTRVEMAAIVSEVIQKTGLEVCTDTKAARISGGQSRRLSIAHALLKQPTVLFLDEPTTGLDSASAANIMHEIVRIAKEEKLIVMCTIHQPSTKVFHGFDQVMVMSKGREAFSGDMTKAISYFDSIGFPCPANTNPAEFFLDLVNSDFSDDTAVESLLDTWQEHKLELNQSSHGIDDTEKSNMEGVMASCGEGPLRTSLATELKIMLRRHSLLIIRDPILYVGRAIVFLFCNSFFSFVYWNARPFEQQQVVNKMWICVWYCAVSTNLAVVAVYALNDEYKSITHETKNGMIRGISYVMAKNILVLPIILIFSVFSLGIPAFVIMDFPAEAAQRWFFLWSATYFVFEAFTEILSVAFDDAILGMMVFMNFYFGSFLFSGFVIPLEDLYYPWTIFYHIMPLSYYGRSALYEANAYSTYETCPLGSHSAVCLQEENPGEGVPGETVLEVFSNIIPLADAEDNTVRDILILIAIGLAYKFVYTIGVVLKSRRVAQIQEIRVVDLSMKDSSAKKKAKEQTEETSSRDDESYRAQRNNRSRVVEGPSFTMRIEDGIVTEVQV